MNKILKQRRVFKKVEKIVREDKAVLNPKYNEQEYIYNQLNYFYYNVDKFITVSVEVKRRVRVSHVEYEIQCEQCKSRCWVRRNDARYCSSTCRRTAFKERKEKGGTKTDTG